MGEIEECTLCKVGHANGDIEGKRLESPLLWGIGVAGKRRSRAKEPRPFEF
jgi:hypothetical protein